MGVWDQGKRAQLHVALVPPTGCLGKCLSLFLTALKLAKDIQSRGSWMLWGCGVGWNQVVKPELWSHLGPRNQAPLFLPTSVLPCLVNGKLRPSSDLTGWDCGAYGWSLPGIITPVPVFPMVTKSRGIVGKKGSVNLLSAYCVPGTE